MGRNRFLLEKGAPPQDAGYGFASFDVSYW